MKRIPWFTCVSTLLATAGWLVAEDGRHRHARYEHHDEIIVGPPVIVVPVPVVVVRPPEIIVR